LVCVGRMVSNQPATFWKALHTGTGGTLVFVHKVDTVDANNRLGVATCDIDANQTGIACFYQPSGLWSFILVNGTNANFYNSGGVDTGGTSPTYWEMAVASGVNGITLRRKSTVLATGTATVMSSGVSQQTLKIGGAPNAATPISYFQGRVRALYHWNRVLSGQDRALVQQYILADSGLVP